MLLARGLDAGNALLLLFSRAGFTADLVTAAAERDEVRLVDLDVLYDAAR
ncbi:MAG: hypothetical protein HHJ10_06965 [Cellulomonas sp.]|nr:hypothetical protein [Cellulomonas sp.]NMM30774.1 hypothetical protein [Cellulomonas sp.]